MRDFRVSWAIRYYSGVNESCYFDNHSNYAAPDTPRNIVPAEELRSTTLQDVTAAEYTM